MEPMQWYCGHADLTRPKHRLAKIGTFSTLGEKSYVMACQNTSIYAKSSCEFYVYWNPIIGKFWRPIHAAST